MSDPKRYGFPWLECDATDEAYMQENGMTELKDGGFVLWADYARLKAEVEAHEKRWAESEDLISHYKQQRDEAINDCECSRLKAEVESLKEAWVDKKMHEDRDTLLRENERLRKVIVDADDKLKLLAEWAVVCEVESAQVNQVRDILRNAVKEGGQS